MSISTTESLSSSRALSASINYVTDSQWECATERHTAAYDGSDVAQDAAEHAEAILTALKAGDVHLAGTILAQARAATISRRVSIELTGRADA